MTQAYSGSEHIPFNGIKPLSYIWGGASDLQTIKLENEFFLVTRNLMAALKQYAVPRKPSSSR